MIEVRESHVIELDEARFWALYADPDFQRRLLVEGLGYGAPKLLEVADIDGGRRWRVEVVPKVELPAAVARLVGGSMAYVETASVWPAKRRMAFTHVTRALGERLALSGEFSTRPQGDGRVVREAVFTVKARIPALGGRVERSTAETIRSTLASTARWLNGPDGPK